MRAAISARHRRSESRRRRRRRSMKRRRQKEEVAGVVSVLDHGETELGISSDNGDVVAEVGSVEVSKLHPPRCGYYEKQINGPCAIPILASSCIADEAMKEAYRRVSRCMRHQPRALKRLIQAGAGALQSPHCIPCHISHSLTVVLMRDCLFLSCLTLILVHVVDSTQSCTSFQRMLVPALCQNGGTKASKTSREKS